MPSWDTTNHKLSFYFVPAYPRSQSNDRDVDNPKVQGTQESHSVAGTTS